MTSILYFTNEIINSILLTVKNKKNQINIAAILLIWIFMGLNSYNADYLSYEVTYYLAPHIPYVGELEVGYLFLEKLGNLIGFSFIQFRGLLYFISLLLIKRTIEAYSVNSYYVIFFYMIYGMFIDSIQFRNFVALSIITFSIKYLIGEERQLFKYIFMVFIASSIHATSLVYLVFILIKEKYVKAITSIISFIAVTIFILTIINGNNIPLLSEILISTQNMRLLRYFDTNTTFGFILPVILHVFNILTLYICKKISRNYTEKKHQTEILYNDPDAKITEFINFTFWANCVLVFIIPFYIINTNFYRFVRNLTIINLIAYSNTNNLISKNILIRYSFNTLVIVNTFSWFFVDFFILNDLSVLIDIFNFNLLF